jgi:phosphoribosylaminoimidazolecarboxamide formyltransferase/IMP cyclohydrolase
MIRAAAKNHAHVTVVTNPNDYVDVLAALKNPLGLAVLRRSLAAKAYAHTAAYDAAISNWFNTQTNDPWGDDMGMGGQLVSVLRYGENPHQSAALYRSGETRPGVITAKQWQGKELSYNNINDTDAAFECVAEFTRPAVVIVKHANPCGVAEGDDLFTAYQLALRCDPVSAFGGIIAVNRELDAKTAEEIAKLFAEVVIAPAISPAARELLASKKNLRVLETGGMPDITAPGLWMKTVAGGLLVQSRDNGIITEKDLKVVTKRAPTPSEIADMIFAWRVAKHVKSNAIVYAKGGATAGVGAGQMSRVDSARIAAHKAERASEAAGVELLTRGSVVASDAFFPFADGLLTCLEAGATAVIQPGGSMRDAEVIAAADEHGIAMAFTGMRH